MLGQTLVLMQMTFLNNVRKVGRLVLSRTSCLKNISMPVIVIILTASTAKQWVFMIVYAAINT
jgi:hypothetical protein